MRKLVWTLLIAPVLAFASLLVLTALVTHSRATVTNTAVKTVVSGNGVTTAFSYAFYIPSSNGAGTDQSYAQLIYTDANGNQTTLANTLWSITGVGTNPLTPGGTFTYPLIGPPIATGTSLTLVRNMPLQQLTSISNQSVVYPPAIEAMADWTVMLIQQVNNLFSRAMLQPISDTQALGSLPAASARANLAICFDSTGYNPIACSTPSSGTISSSMQPVVNAASLAAGRTAFGLGSMATENINAGTCGGATIQDDGAGNARIALPNVSDAVNQSVTCAFHGTQRIASGTFTYTLPRANTLFNGFGFAIFVASGTITVTPNAADNFQGVASGAGIAIPAGSYAWITTNAAASGLWQAAVSNGQASLSANASANALTITLNATAIPFRDTTLANGDSLWGVPAGGLAVTLPIGASLGVTNSVIPGVTQTPFRIWIFAAYNGGAPVLGVARCSDMQTAALNLYPCSSWENIRKSSTLISGSATAAGTLYTGSTAVTNDAIRIIGYAEYANGLATPGTYASGPTSLQLCLPPITCKRPGDVVQTARAESGAVAVGSTTVAIANSIPPNTAGDQYMSQAITPSSSANLLAITHQGAYSNGQAVSEVVMLFQDTTVNALAAIALSNQVGTSRTPMTLSKMTVSGLSVSTTFRIRAGGNAAGTTTFNGVSGNQEFAGVNNSYLEIKEIMGALPEPANDNDHPLALAG